MMLGFAAVILLGTILLCLPVSAADGKAFTGSTPVYRNDICLRDGPCHRPTATTWSTLENCDPRVDSVRSLVSWRGLTMVFLILRRKISLQSRKLIQDTYNLPVLRAASVLCGSC